MFQISLLVRKSWLSATLAVLGQMACAQVVALHRVALAVPPPSAADTAHLPPPRSLAPAEVRTSRLSSALTAAAPFWKLDSADMQQRGVVGIADALRRLPGIHLRDYGGAGGLKTVSVRGLGAAHTKVLLDGLPVEAAQSGQVDFRQFSVARLAEMSLSIADVPELLAPVRALGTATVHLRTKTVGNVVGVSCGAFGAVQPFAAFGVQHCRLRCHLAGSYQYADNDYPFTLRNINLLTHERRHHSRLKESNIESHIAYHWSDSTRLSGKMHWQRTDQLLPGAVVLYTSHATEEVHRQRATAQTQFFHRGAQWQWRAAAKADWHELRYSDLDEKFPNGRNDEFFWERNAYASLGVQHRLSPHTTMAYASDYTLASVNSNRATDDNLHRHSWEQALSARYADTRYTLTLRLLFHQHWHHVRATATHDSGYAWQPKEAARDAHRLTGQATAHWVALRTEALRWTLRAHLQEMFRMPSFAESYYFRYGGTQLRPEQTLQIGIGSSWQLAPTHATLRQMLFTLDAYHNRVKDRIVALPLNTYVWRTTNLGQVEAWGFDLTAHTTWQCAPRHLLHLAVNTSFQSVVDATDATNAYHRFQLPYTPKWTGVWSVQWENPWAALTLSWTAASRRWATLVHALGTDLPPYAEMQIGVQRDFRIGRNVLHCTGNVTNVFHHQYEIIHRYPMPGRAWQVELRYAF